ncbi:shikimate kinase [Microlunatus phosphovorus NM-1]|uniref:Shikimate kinase n=1 Tax=Microlunatus phosphovorus (strain ATCC 700054 / DSM 10555 / JCM 9379 / NBRC 101784 / NCIMB 13414 / VKM Ac-1990 / NM-1) TaxID=1032480 RepID=F5XH27_MICPN|nr:shikimate kinase [Microlunatus phosphovorus]BAK35659.1 shikimate kinase [Microlunatus phosphovorus NM-1]
MTDTARAIEDQAIVLVGASGSGTSTVGRLLAAELGREHLDVDAVIAQRAGKSVPDIFIDDGEAAFRAIEESTTIELLERPAVLSLGSGAVLSESVRAALRGRQVFWLQVSAGTAAERVGLTAARPVGFGNVRGRLIQLLNLRAPLYAEVATSSVATDDHTADEVVGRILERLGG